VDFPVEFIVPAPRFGNGMCSFAPARPSIGRRAIRLKVGYPAPARHVRTMPVTGDVPNLLAGVDPQILEGREPCASVSATPGGSSYRRRSSNCFIILRLHRANDLEYPPWLTLRKLRDQLPSLQRSDEENLRCDSPGVNRIFTMQTDSGG
jgi:hypothetical protein